MNLFERGLSYATGGRAGGGAGAGASFSPRHAITALAKSAPIGQGTGLWTSGSKLGRMESAMQQDWVRASQHPGSLSSVLPAVDPAMAHGRAYLSGDKSYIPGGDRASAQNLGISQQQEMNISTAIALAATGYGIFGGSGSSAGGAGSSSGGSTTAEAAGGAASAGGGWKDMLQKMMGGGGKTSGGSGGSSGGIDPMVAMAMALGNQGTQEGISSNVNQYTQMLQSAMSGGVQPNSAGGNYGYVG